MFQEDKMLQIYMNDISNYPRIDNKREKELAIIIQGSEDAEEVRKAKEELVQANLRLVVKYAMGYYPKISCMADVNLSLMDLINEGNIGLIRAAELFKAEKGTTFSTYAYLSIQRRVKRAVKFAKFVRLPVNHFKYMAELKTLEEEYEARKLKLTDQIIKDKLNITQDSLEMIKMNRDPKVSLEDLEENIGERPDDISSADEITSNNELREYLFEKMKDLKPSHRDVLFMRFFGNEYMTLEEMGKRLGLTRERIRQILLAALKTLRTKIKEEVAMASLDEDNHDTPIWERVKTKNNSKKKEKKKRSNKNEKTGTETDCNTDGAEKIEADSKDCSDTGEQAILKALTDCGWEGKEWVCIDGQWTIRGEE